MTARILAYAKLNLFLEVIGRREDGFHDIRSLVQTIDLADRIAISPGTGISVACDLELNGPNIVETAMRDLLEEKRSRVGVGIHIEKRIPMGAGLGGGSSDAAATLAAVNQLVSPVLPRSALLKLAESIGADVALFLTGGCLRVVNRGDLEETLPSRHECFVILVPSIHCSTREIYSHWHPGDTPATGETLGRNDLYPAAVRLQPQLQSFHDAIVGIGGSYSGMTGSGSGFFAAFSDYSEALEARETLARQQPSCRVYCCQPTSTGFADEGDEA